MSASAVRPIPSPPVTLSSGPSWSWTFASVVYSETTESGPYKDGSSSGYSYTIMAESAPPFDGIYDYSAVKVSATFPIAAYWSLGFNAAVEYTDSIGDAFQGKAQADGKAVGFFVEIYRSLGGVDPYERIYGSNPHTYTLPGRYVDLEAHVTPDGAKKGLTYKWAQPSGVVFQSYTMTNDKATLKPIDPVTGKLIPLPAADLEKQTLQFYWANTGEMEVRCTVTGGTFKDGTPASKDASATLIVEKPSIDPKFTATQGFVAYDAEKLRFGLFNIPRQGIEFVATDTEGLTVKLPPGYFPGEWCFVQTMLPARYRTFAAGNVKEKWSLNSKKSDWKKDAVLDSEVPYRFSFKGDPPAKVANMTALFFATGEKGIATDTPFAVLDATITRYSVGQDDAAKKDDLKQDTFRMYIMFKPAGTNSTWVPLQYIEWWWKGTAIFAKGEWQALTGPGEGKAAALDTTDHPVWTNTFENGTWVPDN